jgi:predicted permease
MSLLADLHQDLRHGVRGLRRSPGFTAMVVLSLALGIGANAAIFSLINALYLRPLPVRAPERLVLFSHLRSPGLSTVYVPGALELYSYPLYTRLRAETPGFEDLAAQQSDRTMTLIRGDDPRSAERAAGRMVSANYFSVLGVAAHRGRTFSAVDEAPAADPALVLSYGYWQRRFGGDPATIGQRITVDGRPHLVVGVAAAGFAGSEVGGGTDFWIPIATAAPSAAFPPDFRAGAHVTSARHQWLLVIGRSKPGFPLATAEASANLILQRFLSDHPETRAPREVRIQLEPGATGVSTLRPRFRQPLTALMAGVGLLLLIVCLNVSHLLGSRAIRREREMGIRSALGASRSRLVRQLTAEGSLLAGLGVAGAALSASWLTDGLLALAASGLPTLRLDVSVDVRVVAFTAALTAIAAAVVGLAPAWRAARPDLSRRLTAHAVASGGRRRASRLLLVSQVALSLILLVGAGLLTTSLFRLRAVDRGFDEGHLLLVDLGEVETGLRGEASVFMYDDVLRAVGAVPGVRAVSLSDGAGPLVGGGRRQLRILLREGQEANWQTGVVTPGYFDTVGMSVRQGRVLATEDRAGTARVAVVNETLARQYFGARAVGARFRFAAQPQEFEVVGVVADARTRSLRETPAPVVYVAVAQFPALLRSLEVRSAVDPALLIEAVRRAAAEAHADLTPSGARTMRSQVNRSLMQERLLATLSCAFGFAALFLVSLGLYGVVAQWAGQRTREIGVRMALGATAGGVRRLVLGQGIGLVAVGVTLGLPAALAAGRLLAAFLFEVRPTDPPAVAAAALTLLLVATAAAYGPARRASRVDPMTALRAE